MNEYWTALKASLAALGTPGSQFVTFTPVPIYITFSASSTPPYVVLTTPAWGVSGEPALGSAGDFSIDIRVKVVAGSPESVATLLGGVRALWGDTRITGVTGHRVDIRWERSEFINVDTDITIPDVNKHPAFGVDTYRLTSQPS